MVELGVTIRHATGGDSESAARVVRAVYEEFGFTWDEAGYHADLYNLEGHYMARGWPFFVAEAGGEVVGTIGLALFSAIPGPVGSVQFHEEMWRVAGADCSMERLYVHPSARRSGVGGLLVSTLVTAAREKGCRAMELWSDKRFVEAHRLYGRLGAQVVGERICHDPDQSPEWGLLLKIA